MAPDPRLHRARDHRAGLPGHAAAPRRRGRPHLRAGRGGRGLDPDREPLRRRWAASPAALSGEAALTGYRALAPARQRVHPDRGTVGLGAGGDHRPPVGARRGSLFAVASVRRAVRRDPFAAAERRALLAMGAAVGPAGAARRRLRRPRGDLLARLHAESPNNCLTSFVRGVLNGFRFCEESHDRMRGDFMSAFEKSLSIAVAAIMLVVATGAAVVSAQGPWAAPPDAKAVKNPVKGVGNAKKAVETNCVSCHGPAGKGDGPAAAALPPPKPANWTVGMPSRSRPMVSSSGRSRMAAAPCRRGSTCRTTSAGRS